MKIKPLICIVSVVALLAGCAHPALREADELSRANQLPQAWMLLDKAVEQNPQDQSLRAARLRVRDQLSSRLIVQIESLRAGGRVDEARQAVQRLREVDPKHPRLAGFETELDRAQRQEAKLLNGRTLLRQGKADAAEGVAREILAESPHHPGARLLLSQSAQAKPLETLSAGSEMGAAYQKQIGNLEFREAPLRQVFEVLSRSADINFVFDKDVRADTRVTLFLRNVTLDEALRVILSTQQLDRKLLNDNSMLIFPNTQAKQREHQELVTRTFYLSNADVKQTQAMVRTIAKVRDLHIDERLNLMVIRDTPEVLRLVERLIASIDLPEPEVMLEVEVMEIASDRVDSLGLQWPESVSYGLHDAVANLVPGRVFFSEHREFRGSIANPAVVATLRGTSGNVNLLANPKIRVRNRDKALVQIGQKVPVFTTTTNFANNTSVQASVSYLDVGLKLEVEPNVQLDSDVSIKLALEVSNLIRQVTGPGGTTAYEIGSRKTQTALRLNDGETQVIAGLINDEDRRSAAGVPGLAGLPLLGRLFGVTTDTRNKTEVVLLITPRIVRNLALPDAANARLPAGTDASPGAFSTQLRSSAKVGGGLSSGSPAAQASLAPPRPGEPAATATASSEAVVRMEVTPQVAPGGTVSVTLRNDSGATVRGEVEYDPTRLQAPAPAGMSATTAAGRIAVELAPRGQRVVVLRALPAANGQVLNVGFVGLSASHADGSQPLARVDGTGLITVDMPR